MKIKEPFSYKLFKGFSYLLLTAFAFVCFYPFWYVLMYSLSDGMKVLSNTGVLFWPKGFTFKAYELVFENKQLLTGFKNTLYCMLIGVPLGVCMNAFGGYFMAQKDLFWKKWIMWYIILTMYISGGTIPLYNAMKSYGMTGNLSIVFLYGAVAFFNMVIMRTAMEGVPESLSESAKMDGANHLTILFRILMPLTKGTFAVIAMYRAVALWGTWYWASVTIQDKNKLPLQSIIRLMFQYGNGVGEDIETAKTEEYATLVITTLPILIAYPFLQKYFTKGVLIGSVKG